jgi:formylglycine-generating enzyme required for sulfatase activity
MEQTLCSSDGGYIIVGTTWSYGSGEEDVWLIKLEGTSEKAMNAEFLSPTTDFSVFKDSNVPLKVKVTYEGEPTTGASLTASFSNGDPDVKLTEGENGIYTGTWTPTSIIEGQVESPVEITVEAYHGTLGRVYAKVGGVIHSGTSPSEVSLCEIIEEVEKLRDKSISKINRDVDNTATLQAKIGKEVYDKEEKNIVINSLQHIQGLLMPGSGILEYFMQFAIFELIDNSFKHFDKEIAEELLNTQSRVDVGCRILYHERDIQDYAMYNTGQENRVVILTEPYESGSHIKNVPNELEIYRYDLHTGIFQFVEKIFRDGVGPDTNLNIETGDLNNDGFEDLLLISGRHIDVYFYDKDTDKFDTSESIQVKAQHAMISDISIGDLDNKGHNELVILSRDSVVSPMSIDVYRFDWNQLNGPLTEPLEPDIATWYPHLVICDVNNDDSHKNELLVIGSTNAILYHYTGTEFNEISKHALPILYAKDIAIGDIDNKKDAKNEFVVIEKGVFSDSIVPFRYNLNTREFDRLDSSQLENDVGRVLKLEICDSTNTGFNNVIAGSKNGIKSYHYEENLGGLEQYLRNEYRDAFMDKEGGPEYHKVVEDINNQYDSFENDIKTKDLTNYPTEEVLKYLKELNKNLDSSSDSETSILVMKTAEKTSEIKKIGTVSQISALVDKTIDDSENNRKNICILGYTIAGGTAVKALLFIKSGGISMVAEAFIYSTTMTGTKYLEQFEELNLHELLQYQSLMSLIALSSEVSVTNDAFQNAVDFALNPTINYIDITKLTLDSIEVNDDADFGFNIGYANVSNNGDNPARVKIFVEISTHVPFEDMEIISVSSSNEYTEIPPNSESKISFIYVAPSVDKWTDDGRLIEYWAWVTATSLNSEIKTRGVKFNVGTVQLGNAITNILGMEFVLIPAGEFEMGSPLHEADRCSAEGPVHHVNIEKPFYMGRYEVSQKQWREIMGDNPSDFKGDNLPVEQVTWVDVQEFIKKLNEKEGTDKYRLPSEAEWEYACRAGTTTRYSFGDSESKLGEYAWYWDNSGSKTHPVGQKKHNSWGLYDMHGNVWEWVQDRWHDNYDGAPADGSAWESGNDAFRVFRGGCWFDDAGFCRSADRYRGDPRNRIYNLGFRLLKEQ